MISSGEVFLLNGETGGELEPLPMFLNQNIRVLAANFDRAYVACEPPVSQPESAPAQPRTVWCFKGDNLEPTSCPEFDGVEGSIKMIAVGEGHLLVLTHDGTVYSRGSAHYGSAGHGGARDASEFTPLPALKGRNVKLVASGPHFSIAVTHQGDVFSWGKGFSGETGVLGQVESVPRFAPAVTKFRVVDVSCGHAHVLASTESMQCIAWGENTCGQLGLGQKSKPTYKPQLLDSIPSPVVRVSAGWAHSMAVGADGRVYSWGLNSHGQLGLGDTTKRLAPCLIKDLVNQHYVESAHCTRALTVLHTVTNRALLCGQVPMSPETGPGGKVTPPEFRPRRPAENDPPGCVLSPIPISMASGTGYGSAFSKLSQVIAFDRGALCFAQSTVFKVAPNLAPLGGGTQIRVHVTGLPFDRPGSRQGADSSTVSQVSLAQDMIPVKVRLRSKVPACDKIVSGRIVDVDTVEFTTPDVSGSPLGTVVERGMTSVVEVQVSIDDGCTWTPGQPEEDEAVDDLDRTARTSQSPGGGSRGGSVGRPQRMTPADPAGGIGSPMGSLMGTSTMISSTMAPNFLPMMLWYAKWPEEGPTHLEPTCAPFSGGTDLLLHIQLPPSMPTDALTVKFRCVPLQETGDPELDAAAPMRSEAAECPDPPPEEVAKLPLAAPLEIPVMALVDPGGRGVRCVTPPVLPPWAGEHVMYYKYFVDFSLDGKTYLPRSLPFDVFNLKVAGLEPNVGPLIESTEVKIKATGYVRSEVMWVRIDFPKHLGWSSQRVSARYDETTDEIKFNMIELTEARVAQLEEERLEGERQAQAALERSQRLSPGPSMRLSEDPTQIQLEQANAQAAEGSATGSAANGASPEPGQDGQAADEMPPDPNSGLSGLEVFVALSLNGQQFTGPPDPNGGPYVQFTYYGGLEPSAFKVLSLPEGYQAEDKGPEDKKAKAKGGKGKEEQLEEASVPPGAKLGCEVKGIAESSFAAVKVDLKTGQGTDEELQSFRTVVLPGKVESVQSPPSPPPPPDPKDKNAPPPQEVAEPEPVDMLTALTPAVLSSELPKDANGGVPPLYMTNFRISLNGQSFVNCDMPRMKLEPARDDERADSKG